MLSDTELWTGFRDLVAGGFREADAGWLSRACDSIGVREGLVRQVLPNAGKGLGLQCKTEQMKIDYSFLSDSEPLVFLEHANDLGKAAGDVRRLARMLAPVRVLLTFLPDKNTRHGWGKGEYAAGVLANLISARQSLAPVVPDPGMLCVLVGGWTIEVDSQTRETTEFFLLWSFVLPRTGEKFAGVTELLRMELGQLITTNPFAGAARR